MVHPAVALAGNVPAGGVGFKWGSARYVNSSLPATNAKRLRKGAEATKQSISSWALWIASRSLSSGAHSRDPLAGNDEH
jgi:hypothetical protein